MAGGQTIPSEASVKKAVNKEFKLAGALSLTIVNQGRGIKGCSDVHHCLDGRWISTEIKRPGRPHPLSSTQKLFLQRVEAAGGIGVVCESGDDARRIIEAVRNGWDIVVAEDRSFTTQPPLIEP